MPYVNYKYILKWMIDYAVDPQHHVSVGTVSLPMDDVLIIVRQRAGSRTTSTAAPIDGELVALLEAGYNQHSTDEAPDLFRELETIVAEHGFSYSADFSTAV